MTVANDGNDSLDLEDIQDRSTAAQIHSLLRAWYPFLKRRPFAFARQHEFFWTASVEDTHKAVLTSNFFTDFGYGGRAHGAPGGGNTGGHR